MTNIRKSRAKKRDAWLQLDEEDSSVYMRHLSTRYPPDYDGDGFFIQRFRLSLGARALMKRNPRKLRWLVWDAMTTSPCGHIYDCCGCWFSYVWKMDKVPGKWEVKVFQRGSFNY